MMRPPRSKAPLHLALALLALAAGASATACSTETTSFGDTVTVVTTAISVEPSDLLGSLECGAEEGGLRSYVVTIFDHTDPTHIAALASSPPTSCSQGVAFRYIIPDHIYGAEIDGYEALAGDLSPSGGPGSGSRHMLSTDGASASPRWTSECTSIKAALHANVRFNDCAEPVDNGLPSPTSIRVDPLGALGALGCASSGGSVVSFDITPDGALPPVTGLPCGAKPIVYNAGITPDEPYTFRLEARAEQGGPIIWGSSCTVIPKNGLQSDAVCDPLASSGTIELSIDAVLKAAGLACGKAGGDITTFEALLSEPDLTTGPVACGDIARIFPLPPAAYSLAVRAYRGNGEKALETTCTATVEPGTNTLATCP